MTVPKKQTKHNPTPRWIMGLRDLPDATALTRYRITSPDGKRVEVALSGRKRQVIEALRMGPLFCASTVRISDAVFRLKQDHEVIATTEMGIDGRKFYNLPSKVELIGAAE